MESIWSQTEKPRSYPPLSENTKVHTAVIGGGLAGVLTAYQLQQKGIPVVVLEASTVGSGQTKNTTAKITSQHNLIYNKLLLSFGKELSYQYAHANQAAIEEYRRIITQKQINCHFEEHPAYLYSTVEQEPLQREAEAAAALGIPACFTTETELPFPVKGALRFEKQAQFHPLQFLNTLAKELQIFENTFVREVKGQTIFTDRGIITAENIVFATHFPFPNFPGYYFARMHQERSYVLSLQNAAQLQGMYLGIDSDGLSFRGYEDQLLLGGGSHRTGENRAGGKYQKLRQKATELYPNSIETAHWSAQDCMTLDGVPYIGPFSASRPNWFVAAGFGKWGMTGSMTAAMIISDQIAGIVNPDEEVFSPQRFTPSASAKSFLQDSLHAVRDLSRQMFAPPRAAIEALPVGHGGIVEDNGIKIGVYKDEKEHIYCVSTRCPHLGCQLEWNPDEKSWDCPCHGSRFDYTGRLIDNPAQKHL